MCDKQAIRHVTSPPEILTQAVIFFTLIDTTCQLCMCFRSLHMLTKLKADLFDFAVYKPADFEPHWTGRRAFSQPTTV